MTGAGPVRVVIADDHPMYRFGLTATLAGNDEIEIVGEAADGEELLAVVEQTQPDVVLTDLAMPISAEPRRSATYTRAGAGSVCWS